LEAFEVIVTLPVALPADSGVNVALKVAVCPAVNVTGVVIPLRLSPVPVIPTWEIVTLELPVLVIVPERDCLLPTVTLPKVRLVGFEVSAPGATPAPDNGTVRVGVGAFEVMVTLPPSLAGDGGANMTLKVALCPAASVIGAVIPLRVKPVPLIATCEIVMLEPPVFVTVSDSD